MTQGDRAELDLTQALRDWAHALGFSQIGVADVDLSSAEAGLTAWLQAGFHGQMEYMARHGLKRARPAELVPGTVRVITARMDYLPRQTPQGWQAIEWHRLGQPARANVSLYARGRDYHKVLRARLQQLADLLAEAIGPLGHRVFCDSAPVLEVELAQRSGLALHRAGAGIMSHSVFLQWQMGRGDGWHMLARTELESLTGQAGRSPLVRRRLQPSVLVAVTRPF
mgnify:CR=1 FL=1